LCGFFYWVLAIKGTTEERFVSVNLLWKQPVTEGFYLVFFRMLGVLTLEDLFIMSKTLSTAKTPRIASYQIPADTWALAVFLVGLAAFVRYIGSDQMHVILEGVLFLVFVVTGLDFVFPLVRPNSTLGGAELKTLALAGAALLAWAVLAP
jgi:hypothetical protein